MGEAERFRMRAAGLTVALALMLAGGLLLVLAMSARPAGAELAAGTGAIAYVGSTCEVDAFGDHRCSNDIYRVATGGSGVPEKLTESPLGQRGAVFPAWSPDGRKIAFAGEEFGTDPENGLWATAEGIYLMDADGSNETDLTGDEPTSGHTPSYYYPAWFPSGKRIVFSKAEQAGGYYADLYTLNVETRRVVRLTSGGAHEYAPVVSPDGRKIAYMSAVDGDWEIYVMKASPEGPANQPVQITNNDDRLVNGFYVGVQDQSPTWSPDGAQIAFASDRDGDYEIYRIKAAPAGAANRPVRLTRNETQDSAPAWSPSGRRIAYGGAGDVWTMRALDGSRPLKLTDNPWGDGSPSWRPLP